MKITIYKRLSGKILKMVHKSMYFFQVMEFDMLYANVRKLLVGGFSPRLRRSLWHALIKMELNERLFACALCKTVSVHGLSNNLHLQLATTVHLKEIVGTMVPS